MAKNVPFRARVMRVESLEARTLLSADGGQVFDTTSEYAVYAQVEEVAEAQPAWYSLASSNVEPSSEEQELLEQINRFRTDPQGELARIFRSYNDDELIAFNNLVNDAILLNAYPKDSVSTFLSEWRSLLPTTPLAFNSSLSSAAASHSSFMRTKNEISHKCSGEDDLATRVAKSGFISGVNSDGETYPISENVGGGFGAYENYSLASYILASFAVDWGVPSHSHRDALMNPDYCEIGVSILQTNKSVGPALTTCDFGTSQDGASSDGAYLLGVVYDDLDGDLFYDVGEGVADVDVLIERLDGAGGGSVSVKTWDSGGYQLFLANGLYRITVSGDQFQTSVSKTISIIDGVNEKLDFRVGDAGMSAPVVDLNGSAEGFDYSVVFVEGSEDPLDVLASSNLRISDDDSAYLYGAKICFENRPDDADETLDVSISGSELRASFEDRSGVITISGTGAIEDYVDAILSLSYFNSKGLCDVALEHTVLISVYDGTSWSNEAKLTINVKPTNLPNMTVNEMVAYEGDSGAVRKIFSVELDSPARLDVSFNFNVSTDGTAVEGADFIVSKGDPIVIPAGQTSAEIECYVLGNYDSLKPEGILKLDNGSFEKPFVYFQLELVDVENANLTNENSLVKGTIYDDDSPIALGTVDEYKLASVLATESGERRYLFTIKPEEEGFFTWNSDSLGLPENAKISVRANELDSDPIATSSATATGGRVQWLADPDVQYWVMIEAPDDFTLVSARLLTITEEKVVLVDPILEGADEELVQLMWLGGGVDLQIGDWLWNFDEGLTAEGMTVKTTLPDIEFVETLPTHSVSDVSMEGDAVELVLNETRGLTTVGFATISFNGADENEELVLQGTSGYDYLYYANGIGYFQTSEGKMFTFSGVNKVHIDGAGGDDYAYVEDSTYNDYLETSVASFVISGGGFQLAATNFNRSFILFTHGGVDEYCALDSGDDVVVSISNGSSITQGSYSIEQAIPAVDAAQADASEEIESATAKYTRVVMGVERTTIAPEEVVGEVVLSGEFSTSSYFAARVGGLLANDAGRQRETSIQRAKTLTIAGLHPYAESRFNVELPENYSVERGTEYLNITDLDTTWVLRAPLWKTIESNTPYSAAFLDNIELAIGTTKARLEGERAKEPFVDEDFLASVFSEDAVDDSVVQIVAFSHVGAMRRQQKKACLFDNVQDEVESLNVKLTPEILPFFDK